MKIYYDQNRSSIYNQRYSQYQYIFCHSMTESREVQEQKKQNRDESRIFLGEGTFVVGP